jgi:methyl-accepting chemotaxis protein
VSNSSHNLKAMTEDVSEGSQENVDCAGAIAQAMDTTSKNVETVARASQEMSASISEISGQMVQSNEVSTVAVSEVKKANEVIEGL